ncbi:DUF3850 domain-containing protein [Echinicola jeungdonensis]|uniref:DUF3850 domain-containing protein n=1 Tax=Echinicola jeungdonensis TaxID=709343 RepID=A0ABV5J9D2_9BACT|nr:DUF3850 domain-containing protein [Echinicola jeungdonensis]MDN3670466.1 DUF3850 domain-containing protein [Echinicola jeungdonensis]
MTHKFRKHPGDFEKAKMKKNWYEVVRADVVLNIGDEVILEEYCPEGYNREAPLPYYTGRMLFSEIKKIINCIKEGYVVLVLNKY